MEDLWPFNEEGLAKAIFGSRIPIISAVGHEIDFTISDFTADARAATPSAAVELSLPDRKELDIQIESLLQRTKETLLKRIEAFRERLKSMELSYGFRRPKDLLIQKYQALDEIERNLKRSLSHLLEIWRSHLKSLSSRLESLSPRNILARGYSISRKLPEHKILKDSAEIEIGDEIEIQLYRGRVSTEVKRKKP